MPSRTPCSVDGCDVPANSKGWCKRHYDRWLRSGSPEFPPKRDPLTAILDRTRNAAGCMVWDGPTTDPQGRGQVRIEGKTHWAHRAVWLLTYGSLPADGLVIRHSCDVAACLNVGHMLLGTQADNMRDMKERERGRWTMCRNGLHELSGDNAYTMPSDPNYRECRECRKERNRRYHQRRKTRE